MKSQTRLLIGTALGALLVGNALPIIGAVTGTITWPEVRSGFLVLNLFLVLPAVPPALLAAWIQSHDPDLYALPAWLNSLSIVLLAIFGYAVSTVLVNNFAAPTFTHSAPLFLPKNIGPAMFQTLIIGVIVFVPAWLIESSIVRWALRSKAAA